MSNWTASEPSVRDREDIRRLLAVAHYHLAEVQFQGSGVQGGDGEGPGLPRGTGRRAALESPGDSVSRGSSGLSGVKLGMPGRA